MKDFDLNSFSLAPFQPVTVFLFAVILVLTACRGSKEVTEGNRYTSHFESELIREEIKESLDSIKRLQNTVVYRTYQFNLDEPPRESDLEDRNFEDFAVDIRSDNHSTAGTAIVLSNRGNKTVLITASHTVSFPDTIHHYSRNYRSGIDNQVEAISVMESTTHFLFGEEGIFVFDVAVNDPRRDLALMVKRWGAEDGPGLKPLEISPGDSDRLDWTDVIYAVGYPRGIQMVTKGMVSKFNVTTRRSFVMDASFNRGFSGGAIFAVRNDGTGLEWVGILTSASAENEYYLAPENMREEDFIPDMEYTGTIQVRRTPRINYGITFAVDIRDVADFFSDYRREIRRQGILLPRIP